MLRRLAILAALLTTAGTTGVLLCAPVYAVEHVICVNNPIGVTCDENFTDLAPAVLAADTNNLDSVITIRVAPGTYSDGPYVLSAAPNRHITLQGSGQGVTVLTLTSGPKQTYVTAAQATVRDLTVTMNAGTSISDTGISATNSIVDSVSVDGASNEFDRGMYLKDSSLTRSTVQMTRGGAAMTDAIVTDGGATVTDSTIVGSVGYEHSGASADTLSRLRIDAYWAGVRTDIGPVNVDDTSIDLGTAADSIGLAAQNDNPGSYSKSITADHVTIVGGGAGSVGAGAYSRGLHALQDSTIQLTNSIVSGPETALYAEATNDGLQGASSTAAITTSYSDWSTQNANSGPSGAATITIGPGHLDVDPAFRNAAGGDLRLATGSPVIDRGAPGTAAPTLDLASGARVLDGNGDGTAVRDMGAYEAPKKDVVVVPDTTAPDTTLTSHPRKRTTKRRASFGFTASETQGTFQCRLDKKTWSACTSPRSYRVTRGWHLFRVRALDAAHNIDPTPAAFRFHRA